MYINTSDSIYII